MRRKISQREAYRTVKQLRELQKKWDGLARRYTGETPGIHLGSLPNQSSGTQFMVNTARTTGCGVAVKMEGDRLHFYAVRP